MKYRIGKSSGARFPVMGIEKSSVTHLAHARMGAEPARVEWQPFIPKADCLGAVGAHRTDLPFCTAQTNSQKQTPVAQAQRAPQGLALPASRYSQSVEWRDALKGIVPAFVRAPIEPAHVRRIIEKVSPALA